jgi:sialic acid synthase SpsE
MKVRPKNLKDYGFNTNHRTYIIAEIGLNHGGDIGVAERLISSAARAGADAVKFQTYITEKRAPKGNQVIYNILKKCELSFDSFKKLQDYSKQYDVDFLSTSFDTESLEYLKSIECDIYKIASFDVVNHKFLTNFAKTGKTIVLSVGMADIEEIKEAYNILKAGTDKIALLHCISAYPTKEDDANLGAIYTLQDKFDCVIGQSDHTNGIEVPLYAVAAGAQIIEKHFKIDENMDCVDSAVSISAAQMKQMVAEIRRIENIFGDGEFGVREAEKDITPFRRYTKLG